MVEWVSSMVPTWRCPWLLFLTLQFYATLRQTLHTTINSDLLSIQNLGTTPSVFTHQLKSKASYDPLPSSLGAPHTIVARYSNTTQALTSYLNTAVAPFVTAQSDPDTHAS